MSVAILLVVIALASVLFHALSPWWFTPLASNWHQMDTTLIITLWISAIVFVAIILFIAHAVVRFRYRPERRAAYEPENKKLEWWLIGLTSLGIVAMLVPGLYVWAEFVDIPKDALTLEAVGQQWQWSFRFPGQDGRMGGVDAALIKPDNPLGLFPGNPFGQDDVLVQGSEVHLPLGRPVKVLLRAKDVLHDFYVPHFRVKMDAVPGMVSGLWFTPTRTGRFELVCAEYCGVGHHTMRGLVVVEEEAAFQAWLKTQPTFAQSMNKVAAGTMAQQSWIAQRAKHEYGLLKQECETLRHSQPQAYEPCLEKAKSTRENLLTQAQGSKDAAQGSQGSASSQSGQKQGAGDGLAARGRDLAQAKGCLGCHSVDGNRSAGPTWKGLYGKTETLADGSTVVVDDDYLKNSISDPNAMIVKGYSPVMPPYNLSGEELDALIAYTKDLSK